MIDDIDPADTHVIQVRAVKKTVTADNPDTPANEADTNPQPGEASRLDLVGPRTVTVGSDFSLPVAVAYRSPKSTDPAKLPNPTVDSSDADNIKLKFDPKEASDSDITVVLGSPASGVGSTSVFHTFPVTVLSAAAGTPTVTKDIPNQNIDGKKLIKLADYIAHPSSGGASTMVYDPVARNRNHETNKNTYVCVHIVKEDNKAKVDKDCNITGEGTTGEGRDHLLITPVKTGGPVDITVTATDTATRGRD